MHYKTALQKEIAHKIGLSMCIGLFTWIGLLLYGAKQLQGTRTGEFTISAGPLLLHTITKGKAGDGQSISLSFETGLVWFFIGFLSIGILTAIVMYRLKTRYAAAGND